MKRFEKHLSWVAALVCVGSLYFPGAPVHAGPDDMIFTQRNSTDTGNIQQETLP